jgi:hypothetical protein
LSLGHTTSNEGGGRKNTAIFRLRVSTNAAPISREHTHQNWARYPCRDSAAARAQLTSSVGHGEKDSQRAYLVSIDSINGIPKYSRAGPSRATSRHASRENPVARYSFFVGRDPLRQSTLVSWNSADQSAMFFTAGSHLIRGVFATLVARRAQLRDSNEQGVAIHRYFQDSMMHRPSVSCLGVKMS